MTKTVWAETPYVAQKIHEAGIKKSCGGGLQREAFSDDETRLAFRECRSSCANSQTLAKENYGLWYRLYHCFSTEMINNIATVARELGIQQKILLKVIEPGDEIYEGQFGGISSK